MHSGAGAHFRQTDCSLKVNEAARLGLWVTNVIAQSWSPKPVHGVHNVMGVRGTGVLLMSEWQNGDLFVGNLLRSQPTRLTRAEA